jgi:hypothetical protein
MAAVRSIIHTESLPLCVCYASESLLNFRKNIPSGVRHRNASRTQSSMDGGRYGCIVLFNGSYHIVSCTPCIIILYSISAISGASRVANEVVLAAVGSLPDCRRGQRGPGPKDPRVQVHLTPKEAAAGVFKPPTTPAVWNTKKSGLALLPSSLPESLPHSLHGVPSRATSMQDL